MNIALLQLRPEPGDRGERQFCAVLEELGHRVIRRNGIQALQAGDRKCEVAFLMGNGHISVQFLLAAEYHRLHLYAPPFHTMVLLDHPLFWRKMLEREGVPLNPWLVISADTKPEREPRVSVLGFPLRVISTLPGQGYVGEIAPDRTALREAVAKMRATSSTVIVMKGMADQTVTAFVGLSASGPILAGAEDLGPGKADLSLALVNHVVDVFELAGPFAIDLEWARDRLLLHEVRLVSDLGPSGEAFKAVGGEYSRFVAGLVEQTSGHTKGFGI